MPIANPAAHAGDGQQHALEGWHPLPGGLVAEEEHGRDRDEQDGDHPVQGLGPQARGPARAEPSAEQAAGEQVQDHGPMRGDGFERHRLRPERQGRGDDHEAHRLVEDHRLECREAERADQQRQAELGAAEADQPAEGADQGAAAECRRARFPACRPEPPRHAAPQRYGRNTIAVAQGSGWRQRRVVGQTFGPASGRARRSSASRSSAASSVAASCRRR